MPTYRLNFTKTAVEKLPIPETNPLKKGGVSVTYKDTKEKGLILIVSNGGAKTYYLYVKFLGAPTRFKIGSAHDITVEQARKEAVRMRGLANAGKNPTEELQALKSEMTFGELVHEFLDKYSRIHKSSYDHDLREIPLHLKQFYSRKLSSISQAEVILMHERMGRENGKTQANRTLERMRAIFNRGKQWQICTVNPTEGIKKYPERMRTRFVQEDEMPYFLKAIELQGNQVHRDFFMIKLLTGARKTNVLQMKWNDIYLERHEWVIPKTKNGEPLVVPLVPEAIKILKRQASMKASKWVFPSDNSKDGHLVDPSTSWDAIRKRATILQWSDDIRFKTLIEEAKRTNLKQDLSALYYPVQQLAKKRNIELPAGLTDLRLHDLRRTYGSWQAAIGVSTSMIGKSLGHKSMQSTKVYEHLTTNPLHFNVGNATAAMLNTRKKYEASNG